MISNVLFATVRLEPGIKLPKLQSKQLLQTHAGNGYLKVESHVFQVCCAVVWLSAV